jgi:hypothetical protein
MKEESENDKTLDKKSKEALAAEQIKQEGEKANNGAKKPSTAGEERLEDKIGKALEGFIEEFDKVPKGENGPKGD